MRSIALVLGLLLSTACSTAPGGIAPRDATPVRRESRRVDADTRVTTAGGATLVAPKGWFVTTGGDLVVLEDPDRTLTVTFVEVQAPGGPDAIATAWKQARADFSRRIQRTSEPPPDPWDEAVRVEYETSTAEARVVVAIGRRKDATWHVTLFDGPRAAFDRRAAEANAAHASVRAPGLVRESWRWRTARKLDAALAARLDRFVEDARRQVRVPGAAVAVVQGGTVVYEKGFGTRRLGGAEPVTPDTLFMVGSITKSLTSLMMAVLVDHGRFTWQTPVTELLPSFALGDAEATRRLTMKHTVCACTGLPRQDMEFFFGYSAATPESRVAAMRTMVPTTGFGETFQYSNGMVSAGGYVAARAHHPDGGLGPAYDRAMDELVLGPLGMTRTTFDFATVERSDHAVPHAMTIEGQWVPLAIARERWVPPIRPAGGAWSSVRDMARYLLVELGDGVTPEGRRVVSAANLRARRKPQVKTGAWSSYGLALAVENLRNVTVLGHGGATSGFSALMFFLPDHDLGGVVLANAWGAGAFTSAVRGRLLELLFDGREDAARRLDFTAKQRARMLTRERARLDAEPDPALLRPLVATYASPSLGRVTLRADGRRVVFDAGDWESALGYRKESDGTEKLVLLDPPWAYFELVVDRRDGRPRLVLERPQHRYVFEAVRPSE